MSNQIAEQQAAAAPKSFAGMLERMKPQLAAALPKHLSAERMMRVALTCYRMTPKLAECRPESVMAAVVQCAQLGLEPGLLGQAYLIPFKKNKKVGNEWTSHMECQFIPGYKGLIALARRSGEVTSISTEIVYENDKFKLTLGVDPNCEHQPFLDGDRGDIRLVYGVAKFKDGGYHFEWMPIADVEKIRQRSMAKDNGPWKTDYEQMVRKTLIRRMANYLPMSVELNAAISVSDAHEQGKHAALTFEGDFIQVETSGDTEEETPSTGTAGLKDRIKGTAAADAQAKTEAPAQQQDKGKTEAETPKAATAEAAAARSQGDAGQGDGGQSGAGQQAAPKGAPAGPTRRRPGGIEQPE